MPAVREHISNRCILSNPKNMSTGKELQTSDVCKSLLILLVAFLAFCLAEVRPLYVAYASTGTPSDASTLNSGLVGWWTFDGKNMAKNVADSSGNGNNGDMMNFTSTSSAEVPGKIGQALKFNGTSSYVATNKKWNTLSSCSTSTDQLLYPMDGSVTTTQNSGYLTGICMDDGSDFWVTIGTPPSGGNKIWVQSYDGNAENIGVPYSLINYSYSFKSTRTGPYTFTKMAPLSAQHRRGILATTRTWKSDGMEVSGQRIFQGRLHHVRTYNRALSSAEVQRLG